MEPKAVFLVEAAKALGATANILEFFGREPMRRSDLDHLPLVDAMLGLCQERRRDCAGITDIRLVTGVLDKVRSHRSVTTDEIQSGIESAKRYRQWLHQTFTDARGRPDQN